MAYYRPSLEAKKAYVREYLQEHPCVDCGETDVDMLQFDHRVPSEKTAGVFQCVHWVGIEKLKEEIDKCDIRCANHHTKRHKVEFRSKERINR